ncbi:hypothetical protein XELAEV_18019493mg [Xenopus laevis]|nr:hypothetical protein XELAEV_18019493mg [Xenopus laevis]
MTQTYNQSTIKEMLLLGFNGLHNFRTTVFFVLLGIYMATIIGNLLIIAIISTTRHLLQSPMYYFLSQLAINDILLTTTVCPYMLHITWNEGAYMSVAGCIIQFYMFGVSSVTECFLLTAMSYDRYLAICKPLHYASTMTYRFCVCLVMCCWLLGFMITLVIAVMISNLNFCGPHIIDHLFCDYAPLMDLSCSNTTILKFIVFSIASTETITETVFIIATYVCIFLNIVRISSSSGRQKAFSTCSSHLAVVCTYYGSLISIYVAPSKGHLIIIKKILSLMYTVVTPLLNPIIYSLKNLEIQAVIKKFVRKHKNTF